MATIQLKFNLHSSSNVKTIHLLGSWDNYKGLLPLFRDSAETDGWTGTFKFQSATLNQAGRYWYYYIVDGCYVSYDPARKHTVEPTTQRMLNILDIPTSAAPAATTGHVSRVSADVANGRALSPSKIISPIPVNPGQTYNVLNYTPTGHELTSRFSAMRADTDTDSDVPSGTSSRSSASSSPSSVGNSCCTCERYAITRSGNRVRLDCSGSRCGSDEDCSSESENETYRSRATRRQGMVIN